MIKITVFEKNVNVKMELYQKERIKSFQKY